MPRPDRKSTRAAVVLSSRPLYFQKVTSQTGGLLFAFDEQTHLRGSHSMPENGRYAHQLNYLTYLYYREIDKMIPRKNNLAAGPELRSQVGNGGEAQAQWLVSQLIPPMRSKCATLGEWEGGREEATEEGREAARNMCHTHRMNAATTPPKAASASSLSILTAP